MPFCCRACWTEEWWEIPCRITNAEGTVKSTRANAPNRCKVLYSGDEKEASLLTLSVKPRLLQAGIPSVASSILFLT